MKKYLSLAEKKRRIKNGEVPKTEVCPACGAHGNINWHDVTCIAECYHRTYLAQCKVCKLVFDKDEIIDEQWNDSVENGAGAPFSTG